MTYADTFLLHPPLLVTLSIYRRYTNNSIYLSIYHRRRRQDNCRTTLKKQTKIEMWANAQRDGHGRPAE